MKTTIVLPVLLLFATAGGTPVDQDHAMATPAATQASGGTPVGQDHAMATPAATQASDCLLPYESGSCTDYSVHWFFDAQYGGCSRFHYGGCGGNRNRFSSKEECEGVCIRPANKDDLCRLPSVKGSCAASSTRWYYDGQAHRCNQFEYGGCLGNANNFETRELCEVQCV